MAACTTLPAIDSITQAVTFDKGYILQQPRCRRANRVIAAAVPTKSRVAYSLWTKALKIVARERIEPDRNNWNTLKLEDLEPIEGFEDLDRKLRKFITVQIKKLELDISFK
jgi:hypothetical protein